VAKPFRRAAIILLWAALVVATALLLAQDQETLRVRSEIAAADPRSPAFVAALVGAALTLGNRYEVLTNGDQFFPSMLQAIDRARRRINFETYIYDTGEIANKFTDALERAARRGVHVTLVADAVGAWPDPIHTERLRIAGARVLTFNPAHWYSPEDVNFRTHRKILVIDGEIGFTGGAGVADHWQGHAQDADHWRDTQVWIQGPIVRLLEAAFYENAMESHGPMTPELDDTPITLDEQGASIVIRSSPTGGSTDLKRLYLLAIASARRTLDITSPYFVTDELSMWALEDAVRRGVKIRILVEGDITDAMPVKYASRAAYDTLMTLGIELYEYRPTMMHTKTLVVDGVLSIFGSANFDNRSLELNDELNVAVWNRELGARFTTDFEQDLRASTRLDLRSWRQRSLLQKSREQFWSYFGEVF
jgi:cardiolipin synthase A/B